jgi:hypothetical protein
MSQKRRRRRQPGRVSANQVGHWQDWCSVESVVEEGQRAIRQAHADGRTANGRVPVMAFGGHGGQVFEVWSDGEIRELLE